MLVHRLCKWTQVDLCRQSMEKITVCLHSIYCYFIFLVMKHCRPYFQSFFLKAHKSLLLNSGFSLEKKAAYNKRHSSLSRNRYTNSWILNSTMIKYPFFLICNPQKPKVHNSRHFFIPLIERADTTRSFLIYFFKVINLFLLNNTTQNQL